MTNKEFQQFINELGEIATTIKDTRTSLWEDWETDHDDILQALTHAHDRIVRIMIQFSLNRINQMEMYGRNSND